MYCQLHVIVFQLHVIVFQLHVIVLSAACYCIVSCMLLYCQLHIIVLSAAFYCFSAACYCIVSCMLLYCQLHVIVLSAACYFIIRFIVFLNYLHFNQAMRGCVSGNGDKLSPTIRRAVTSTLVSLISHSEDTSRLAAAGCLGSLVRWLPEEEQTPILTDLLAEEPGRSRRRSRSSRRSRS